MNRKHRKNHEKAQLVKLTSQIAARVRHMNCDGWILSVWTSPLGVFVQFECKSWKRTPGPAIHVCLTKGDGVAQAQDIKHALRLATPNGALVSHE